MLPVGTAASSARSSRRLRAVRPSDTMVSEQSRKRNGSGGDIAPGVTHDSERRPPPGQMIRAKKRLGPDRRQSKVGARERSALKKVGAKEGPAARDARP